MTAATHQKGMTVAEFCGAFVVLCSILLLGMFVVKLCGFFDNTSEDAPMALQAKLIYAEKRLRELDSTVKLFAEQYGTLPGDYAGHGLSTKKRGNGNKRVERQNGEHLNVFQHLKDAKQFPTATPLFLKRPIDFYWLDSCFLNDSGQHYFIIRDLPLALAPHLDKLVDDGKADSGAVGYVPSKNKKAPNYPYCVDMYVRFRW